MHRVVEALEYLLPEHFKIERHLPGKGFVNRRGYTHAARRRQLLYALGLNDPRSGNGFIRDDDLAYRDTYSNTGFDIILQLLDIVRLAGLEGECGRYRVRGMIETGQQGVTPDFEDPAVISCNAVAEAPETVLDTFVGQPLVLLHQHGRSGNVRVQYDDEPAGETILCHLAPSKYFLCESRGQYTDFGNPGARGCRAKAGDGGLNLNPPSRKCRRPLPRRLA